MYVWTRGRLVRCSWTKGRICQYLIVSAERMPDRSGQTRQYTNIKKNGTMCLGANEQPRRLPWNCPLLGETMSWTLRRTLLVDICAHLRLLDSAALTHSPRTSQLHSSHGYVAHDRNACRALSGHVRRCLRTSAHIRLRQPVPCFAYLSYPLIDALIA